MMLRFATLALALAGEPPAPGPPAAPGAPPAPLTPVQAPDEELVRRRLAEVLTATKVTVEFDATPAREAFGVLGKHMGIPLVGRYLDDPTGHGIDPERPITLRAADRPALSVLEDMLAACNEPGSSCTWQIRKGFVEFGTKERLSVPAARETRTYYIADLIAGGPARREVMALELVQKICETVEPGIWDYGQPVEPDDVEAPPAPPVAAPDFRVAPPGPDAAPPPDETPPPAEPAEPSRPAAPSYHGVAGRYVPHRSIAIIRYWRDVIIVHAPDYVHRQIGGYGKQLPAFRVPRDSEADP